MKEIIIGISLLCVLSIFFAIVIAVLSDVLKVEETEEVEKVLKMLPGYNCGACGKSGCLGLAKAIVEEGESPSLCRPIKQEQLKQLNEFLTKINDEKNH